MVNVCDLFELTERFSLNPYDTFSIETITW